MGMSDLYGPADETESIATIHAALDAGITLLDTGDFYGMGHNELLLRDALRAADRDDVVISVKFGALRDPDGGWLGYDAPPGGGQELRSPTRCGGWAPTTSTSTGRRASTRPCRSRRPSARSPSWSRPATSATSACPRSARTTLRRAAAVHPIADLQIEYSLLSRGIEDEILPTARELGIGVTAYGVLSRGLLSGHWSPDRETVAPATSAASARASRARTWTATSRWSRRCAQVAEAAASPSRRSRSPGSLAQGEDIVPLVGARRRERLDEALGATELELSAGDLAAIERAVPAGAAAGARYPEAQVAHLDSER